MPGWTSGGIGDYPLAEAKVGIDGAFTLTIALRQGSFQAGAQAFGAWQEVPDYCQQDTGSGATPAFGAATKATLLPARG